MSIRCRRCAGGAGGADLFDLRFGNFLQVWQRWRHREGRPGCLGGRDDLVLHHEAVRAEADVLEADEAVLLGHVLQGVLFHTHSVAGVVSEELVDDGVLAGRSRLLLRHEAVEPVGGPLPGLLDPLLVLPLGLLRQELLVLLLVPGQEQGAGGSQGARRLDE